MREELEPNGVKERLPHLSLKRSSEHSHSRPVRHCRMEKTPTFSVNKLMTLGMETLYTPGTN